MEENLVGYLLGALDPETTRDVEKFLDGEPAARQRLDVLRRALAPGGLCVDCHTVRPVAGPLGGEISPVHLANRVLPWGDFNHGVPAHAGVGTGAAACAGRAPATEHASAAASAISTPRNRRLAELTRAA